jgi:hypothetical protein
MDDLALVQRIVSTMVRQLSVPVSCKIRRFDSIDATVAYAQMVEVGPDVGDGHGVFVGVSCVLASAE